MGLTLAAILIGKDFRGSYPQLLERLGRAGAQPAGPVTLSEVSKPGFDGTAIGSYSGATLLIDPYLPYDCSHRPDRSGPLDERLAELSAEAPVLCFFSDETSMSFGFSFYQDGRRVRGRLVTPEELLADFGLPLPAEAPFDPARHDDTRRIWALTATFLGEPLDRLVGDGSLTLTSYQTRHPGA
jgi:Family of unknown function (DUF6928)